MVSVQVVQGEGVFDDLGIAGKEELCSFLQNICDHHHGDVVLLFLAELLQGFDKRVRHPEERFRIDRGNLRDREGMRGQMEFLHIVAKEILGRHIGGNTP